MIALEFKRSILIVTDRSETVFQVQRVVLIALLAVLRKFIILEPGPSTAFAYFALGFGTLALGALYYLMRREDLQRGPAKNNTPGLPDPSPGPTLPA